jgi:hypothetical protein
MFIVGIERQPTLAAVTCAPGAPGRAMSDRAHACGAHQLRRQQKKDLSKKKKKVTVTCNEQLCGACGR